MSSISLSFLLLVPATICIFILRAIQMSPTELQLFYSKLQMSFLELWMLAHSSVVGKDLTNQSFYHEPIIRYFWVMDILDLRSCQIIVLRLDIFRSNNFPSLLKYTVFKANNSFIDSTSLKPTNNVDHRPWWSMSYPCPCPRLCLCPFLCSCPCHCLSPCPCLCPCRCPNPCQYQSHCRCQRQFFSVRVCGCVYVYVQARVSWTWKWTWSRTWKWIALLHQNLDFYQITCLAASKLKFVMFDRFQKKICWFVAWNLRALSSLSPLIDLFPGIEMMHHFYRHIFLWLLPTLSYRLKNSVCPLTDEFLLFTF
jgi:hypothetical protein